MANENKSPSPAGAITREELLELLKTNNEQMALMVAGMMAAPAQKVSADAKAAVAAHEASLNTCGDCGQKLKACKGKHRKLVVLPRDARTAQWFPGFFLNGVKYRSNHPGHAITVPAESNPESFVEAFEEQEDYIRNGRSIFRNSGGIGVGSQGFSAAYPGLAKN